MAKEPNHHVLQYPDAPLGPQLRPFGEGLSAFKVLRDHFFPQKKDAPAKDASAQ